MEGHTTTEYPTVCICCHCMQWPNLRLRWIRWQGTTLYNRGLQPLSKQMDRPLDQTLLPTVECSSSGRGKVHLHPRGRVVGRLQYRGLSIQHLNPLIGLLPQDDQGEGSAEQGHKVPEPDLYSGWQFLRWVEIRSEGEGMGGAEALQRPGQ